jgi:hypothetical protein
MPAPAAGRPRAIMAKRVRPPSLLAVRAGMPLVRMEGAELGATRPQRARRQRRRAQRHPAPRHLAATAGVRTQGAQAATLRRATRRHLDRAMPRHPRVHTEAAEVPAAQSILVTVATAAWPQPTAVRQPYQAAQYPPQTLSEGPAAKGKQWEAEAREAWQRPRARRCPAVLIPNRLRRQTGVSAAWACPMTPMLSVHSAGVGRTPVRVARRCREA